MTYVPSLFCLFVCLFVCTHFIRIFAFRFSFFFSKTRLISLYTLVLFPFTYHTQNRINGPFGQTVAKVLNKLTTLKELDLSNNHITGRMPGTSSLDLLTQLGTSSSSSFVLVVCLVLLSLSYQLIFHLSRCINVRFDGSCSLLRLGKNNRYRSGFFLSFLSHTSKCSILLPILWFAHVLQKF